VSKWGETEALCITAAVGKTLISTLRSNVPRNGMAIRYRGGETYLAADMDYDLSGLFAYSALFPNSVDMWGSGAVPLFSQAGGGFEINGLTYYTVLQRFMVEARLDFFANRYTMFNKLRFNHAVEAGGYPLGLLGSTHFHIGMNFRNMYFINCFKKIPADPNFWSTDNGDRRSSSFQTNVITLRHKNMFSSESGCSRLMRGDRSTVAEQSTTDRSHGFYTDTNLGASMDDVLVGIAALTAYQARGGASFARAIAYMCNSGFFTALGNNDDGSKLWASFSSHTDEFITRPGQKDIYRVGLVPAPNAWTLSGAWTNKGKEVSYRRAVAAHATLAPAFETGQEIGFYRSLPYATGRDDPGSVGGDSGSAFYDDRTVTDWLLAEYERPNGLTVEQINALRAATIEVWLENKIGGGAKTIWDVDAYLRSLDEPWTVIEEILEHVLSTIGKWLPRRSEAGDVHFLPPDDRGIAGFRGVLLDNWTGLRLPGHFPGENLFWDGARANSNFTPKYTLVDYNFGSNAWIIMTGGKHESTGELSVGTLGARLDMNRGCKFIFAGYAGANPWTVDVIQSRWHNKGDVSGPVSLVARHRAQAILAGPGKTFTIDPDHVVEVVGDAKVGWWGTGGGTGTIENDGILRFRSQCRLWVDNVVRPGGLRTGNAAPLPGATVVFGGGGTARVIEVIDLTQTQQVYVLDELAGPAPADNETITGVGYCGPDSVGTIQLGLVNGAPQVVATEPASSIAMGCLTEFRPSTSHHAAPDMVSRLALKSGLISLRVGWLPDGSYPLAICDDITNIAAAISGGSSGLASGKAGRVTVDLTANTMTLVIGAEGGAGLPASDFDLVVV
jgi:hypothetical protein